MNIKSRIQKLEQVKVDDFALILLLDGDTAAAKILLDRCCPVLKPQAMAINLPVNGSLAEQGGEIIRATMTGEIPADIGSQLITALSNQRKVNELQELTQRLDRIEKQLTHEQSLEYLK